MSIFKARSEGEPKGNEPDWASLPNPKVHKWVQRMNFNDCIQPGEYLCVSYRTEGEPAQSQLVDLYSVGGEDDPHMDDPEYVRQIQPILAERDAERS